MVYIGKKMKNIIDLDEIRTVLTKRGRINRIDVREAVFIYKNKEVKVSKKMREDWRFTGLNTIDFAENVFVNLVLSGD